LKRRPAEVRAVLFDLDGVLVDSQRYWFLLFNQALVHFGHRPVTRRTFGLHWGQSTAEDVRIFMPERTVAEVRRYFQRHQSDSSGLFRVPARVRPALNGLRQRRLKLACVTNSHRRITRRELAATGLRRYFTVIVTADDVRRPKPAPDMLRAACRRLGVKPGQVLFVGDTRTDELAARRGGCRFIGYRYPARVTIRDLSRLLAIVDRGFPD
jgi:HAD superfamily hydrolase (TIGR01509 family)